MRSIVFSSRIIRLFLLALSIIAAAAVSLYLSFTHFKEQQVWIDHTYRVINKIEMVFSELKDVQSAQRGYVITGKEPYLEPYNEAVPRIVEILKELRILVADNPLQLERLNLVEPRVMHRLQIAATIIKAYQEQGQEAAFALIRGGSGVQDMNEVRSTTGEMVRQEELLLKIRQEEANHAADVTLIMGSLGLLASVAIIFWVFLMIHRETMQRSETEDSLKHAIEQMRQISIENQLIGKMGDYFQSCNTPEEAYDTIGKTMRHILPNTFGFVSIFNNSRNLVEKVLEWGRPCCSISREFEPEACWALRRGQWHHIHPNGVEPVCAHINTVKPEGGSLCIPMQAHGETIGLFFIAVDDEKELDEHLRIIARTVSEQISLAISNLKLQEKLRQQSIRDPLTRMFNRRYLEETLEREISRAQRNETPLSILMMDLDHFKRLNDTYGHDAGDAVLVAFSKLILEMTRKEDIACRYGGEEFLVVMPGCPVDAALKWAEKLNAAVRDLVIKLSGQQIRHITVSIGVASFGVHATHSAGLVKKADAALYKAKQNGRNQAMLAEADVGTFENVDA